MFNFIKERKTNISIVTNVYTVRWKEDNARVTFTEFVEVIDECNLKIVSFNLRRELNYEGVRYWRLDVILSGRYMDHEKFRDLCLVDRRMDYLRKLGEGF